MSDADFLHWIAAIYALWISLTMTVFALMATGGLTPRPITVNLTVWTVLVFTLLAVLASLLPEVRR